MPLRRRQAKFDLDTFQLPYPRVSQRPQHQKRTQSVAEVEEEAGHIGRAHRLPGDGADVADDEVQVHDPAVQKAGQEAVQAQPQGCVVGELPHQMQQVTPVRILRTQPVPQLRREMLPVFTRKHTGVFQDTGQKAYQTPSEHLPGRPWPLSENEVADKACQRTGEKPRLRPEGHRRDANDGGAGLEVCLLYTSASMVKSPAAFVAAKAVTLRLRAMTIAIIMAKNFLFMVILLLNLIIFARFRVTDNSKSACPFQDGREIITS